MFNPNPDQTSEAQAFDARITERRAAGYIPDLRRAVSCPYFYKSFWREPLYIDLYLGDMVRTFLKLIAAHAGSGQRILDVGCGAGYITLELAREGHHVIGIDIAPACIDSARAVLADNPFRETFGSLTYQVASLEEFAQDHIAYQAFDVVLFSGILHHLSDPTNALLVTKKLLRPGGIVVCLEPCHEAWTEADAAQVTLIRSLLAITGHWYEPNLADDALTPDRSLTPFRELRAETAREYREERDRNEAGQSPQDNSSGGAEILAALREQFTELAYRPGYAFLYRVLGGLRGPDDVTAKLAELLYRYDQAGVADGFLRPNSFFFVGRTNH